LIITPFTAQALLGADPALADDPRVLALMPPWDIATVKERAKHPPTKAQRRQLATEMANYRLLTARGARLALGTDSPLVPVGLSLHLALRALHAHGYSPSQALHSATTIPARLFGIDDLGTIQPGRIADLVVVAGDPFTDFDSLINTSLVVREGAPHQPSALTTLRPTREQPPSGAG
jgi:imidazolonepropionase-like amidohydrolase